MIGMLPIARRLPHNVDAEMALLGAIILNNRVFDRACQNLSADHFTVAENRVLFEACSQLIQTGRIADPVTLKAWVAGNDAFSAVDGVDYLHLLCDCATTATLASSYADTIRDLAILRQLIAIGEEIVARAYDPQATETASDQVEQAEIDLSALAGGKIDEAWRSISAAALAAVKSAEAAHKGEAEPAISTGLADVDRIITGLLPGKLYVIGSRPAMGKTAIAINMAVAAARKGNPVGFFSMEMQAEEIGLREVARASSLPAKNIAAGDVRTEDFAFLIEHVRGMESLPLWINDTPGLTVQQIRSMTRRAKAKHKFKIVVVDYLQLCRTAGKRDWTTVGEISTGLKLLAREENIAVIALCQLNRDVEKRDNKRPTMADLRETGNIEQDADVIMFLTRPEVYMRRTEPPIHDPEYIEWQKELERVTGLAELVIDKHRGGETGLVRLHFDAERTSFGNLAQEML